MKRIVVFASGSGTNAENIIKYFRKSDIASVNRFDILDFISFRFSPIISNSEIFLVKISEEVLVLEHFSKNQNSQNGLVSP